MHFSTRTTLALTQACAAGRSDVLTRKRRLQVRDGSPQHFGVITKLADADIALRAQDAAYRPGDMIVVDVPLRAPSIASGLFGSANCATIALCRKHGGEHFVIDAVQRFDHVAPLVSRMDSVPVLHRATRGAELCVMTHLGNVHAAVQANIGDTGWRIPSSEWSTNVVQTVAAPTASFSDDRRLKCGRFLLMAAAGAGDHNG